MSMALFLWGRVWEVVCVSVQIGWLNSYHSTVAETVGAYLRETGKDGAYRWLLRETEPLG